MTFTSKEKLECAEREVMMRRKVYPRWIEQKKMKQETADRQIAIMDAIAEDYRKQEAEGRLL